MIHSKGNMKSRHFLLFLASCTLLYLSDLFAGSLIAIAIIFQFNLLYKNVPLTRISQWTAFKLFICAIPLFFFLGGIHSFVSLYFNEGQWLYLTFALTITCFLCFLANFFSFFVFNYLLEGRFNISIIYQTAFMNIKHKKKRPAFADLRFAFFVICATLANRVENYLFSYGDPALFSSFSLEAGRRFLRLKSIRLTFC